MESKFLEFRTIDVKPKTFVYGVFSKTQSTRLGIIKWYAPWRQYCFFPQENTLYSKGCLEDIANFIGELRR